MNGYVGGFHLLVRTHINCRRYSAPGSRSNAALLKLSAASDRKLPSDIRTRIEDYVQASLAFE
jgi:hypothetical protein